MFSVRSTPDPPIVEKIAIRSCLAKIQSWSGQNWLQPWSGPIQSWSVLISGTSLV